MNYDQNEAKREILRKVTESTKRAMTVSEEATRAYTQSVIADHVREYVDARALNGLDVPDLAGERLLCKAIYDEIFLYGTLQPFIEDPTVENIDVNGYDQVWITYSDGRKESGPPIAESNEELVEKIQRWAAYDGQTARDFSIANPRVHLSVRAPTRMRMAALIDVTPWPSLSFRLQHMLDVDMDWMVQSGTIDRGLRDFLLAAVRARKDIVITGGMGDGKTTFARALCSAITPDERIATVEKEYELFLHEQPERHRDVLAMEAREGNSEGLGAVSVGQLIQDGLRFNCRRIIVGEVRGDELISMLAAMNTGGNGSICTMHADSAEQVFQRMLILAGSGGLNMAPETLFRTIGMAVDFVIHLGHDVSHDLDDLVNRRYVREVYEVLPPGDSIEPAVNRVYIPGPDGRAVPNTIPQCMNDLISAGFDPDAFVPRAWMGGRV
ncbi:CpaF family protein [Nonomuraea sp. NPDC050556]|uniref:CpaF family protein n=1 Tax=Nonomuraea sp. NPDC050556 TaxID=3364369 RepID=UPI0037B7CE88